MKQFIFYALLAITLPLSLITRAQVIKTVAGTGEPGYTGDGGPAVTATLNHPDVVKFDKKGNMYIADEHNNAIRKVNPYGIITTIAGNGTKDAAGHGGPATAAHIYRPTDLCFDTKGNLYVAEAGNNIISKISTSGIITIIAGTGVDGNTGDTGMATAARIHNPIGLVFDSVGNLYFSSNGAYCIRKIDTAGKITTFAGTGIGGYSGDKGPATAAQIGLTGYLAFGRYKALYIPDYYNHVVRRIDSQGVITTIAGSGAMGTAGDKAPATAAAINSPYAIFFDYKHYMYISDRFDYVVRMVDTFDTITTYAGTGVAGFNGDGDIPINTQFNTDLNCSDSDATGNFYIADPLNNRVRRVTYTTVKVSEINGQRSQVTIYPNPAHSMLNISSSNDKLSRIVVVDITGNTVFDHTYSYADKTQVDISRFANGTYFIKVNDLYSGSFVKD
ncbi:MAG: hypothetical protein JWQ38_2710 [Flavipsychrobacter sp.]|nr:hypothetical protein [Flavipsychrobacter sp.]